MEAPATDHFRGRARVRVVVAGDRGTGKSSLISTAATKTFSENINPLLPPTNLPTDYYPDRVPVTIVDTSSSREHRRGLVAELQQADIVVLTYSCDRPATLERLKTYWLPELRRLEVTVPVIVVGCKLDLRCDEQQETSLEQVMLPIMQQFREIETCVECSALRQIQTAEVFYFAQKAVLHPTAPVFDQETHSLRSRCVRALKRIFVLCDHDKDGALSDAELNDFQIKCFNAPLQQAEIVGVRNVVQERRPDGVDENGLTLTGFLFLHALFIEKGKLETTWTVLRKFGYGDDLKLKEDLLPLGDSRRGPDQSVELTDDAIEFLKEVFGMYDIDSDGALRPVDLESLFSTAPESPWEEFPYKDAAQKNVLGGLSIEGFLSEWSLMTLLEPASSIANLIYTGYGDDPLSAFRTTRKRSVDRKLKRTRRNVLQCFVFGPKNAGKSALLDSLVARPFSDGYTTPTSRERFAANVVDLPAGIKRTLVLREIPADDVKSVLSSRESLAACDVAVFVYDSSDEKSWNQMAELLLEVATHGETTGFEVPCLIVSAKDDLGPYPMAVQDSTRVSQDMGIETPIPVSMRLGEFNNVFQRIINAAEHPHLSIPETEAGKQRKRHRQLVDRSLMFVSVGAAVAVVGLAAYRVYAARKNGSS